MKDSCRRAMFARLSSNKAVAQAFAQGATRGKTKHLFIEGDTVYSYGYHFPIARRKEDKTVEFTTRGYSSTTSRHKSLVRGALRDEGYTIKERPIFPNEPASERMTERVESGHREQQ